MVHNLVLLHQHLQILRDGSALVPQRITLSFVSLHNTVMLMSSHSVTTYSLHIYIPLVHSPMLFNEKPRHTPVDMYESINSPGTAP